MHDNGYNEYRPIRNYIRRFDREQLLCSLMILSCKASKTNAESWSKGYVPWELLLIGKWIVLDWENIRGNAPADIGKINNLINRVKVLTSKSDLHLLKSGQGVMKFLRRLAFLQFWHQKKLNASAVGRSILLLIEANFSSKLTSLFEEAFGLTHIEFMEVMFLIWTGYSDKNESNLIGKDYLLIIRKILTEEKESLFFKNFSLNLDEMADFSESIAIPQNYFTELFKKTPFLSKPFLHDRKGQILLWSTAILNEIIEHGIYDHMKRLDSDNFCDEFSKVFESYLKDQLIAYQIHFIDEQTQKRVLKYEKQVDFLVEDEKNVILIEAKAIEATHISQINPSNAVMENSYEGNVVKALDQANKVYLQHCPRFDKVPYAIIVSYKELYLGNGEDAWDEFVFSALKDKFKVSDYKIPKSHIFFMSVDGFDKLMVCCEGQVENLVKLLERIVKKKRNQLDRRFVFSQYLEDFEGIALADRRNKFLEGKFDTFFENTLRKYFPEETIDFKT